MSLAAMAWVWEHSKLKGQRLLLLLAIADRCDDEGVCFPGIKRLAKKARYGSNDAAGKALKALEAAGEIIVRIGEGIDTKHGATNRYYMSAYRASIGLDTPKPNRPPTKPPSGGTGVDPSDETPLPPSGGTGNTKGYTTEDTNIHTPEALPATDEQATTTPADDIFPMDEHGYWDKSLTHPGMFQERVYAGASLPPKPESLPGEIVSDYPTQHVNRLALAIEEHTGQPPDEALNCTLGQLRDGITRELQATEQPEPEPPTPFATMQAAVIAAFGNKSYWWAGIRANLLLGTVKDKTGGWKQYQMTEQPATVAEVLGFIAWWKRAHPGATPSTYPTSAEKLRDNFERFRGDASYNKLITMITEELEREMTFENILSRFSGSTPTMPDAPLHLIQDIPEDEMPTPEELVEWRRLEAIQLSQILGRDKAWHDEEPTDDQPTTE